MSHTQYDYDKLFLAYEESRADITAHFRKIMELEREIEKLKKQNEIMREALSFYADIERWKTVEHCELKSKIRIDAADFDAKIDNDMMYFIAGKMARQALKDVEDVG